MDEKYLLAGIFFIKYFANETEFFEIFFRGDGAEGQGQGKWARCGTPPDSATSIGKSINVAQNQYKF
ncbi:hypothetical protein FHS57_006347 [Runella defluvii]|uniref:Uncharacterized protein n=1 Tax=Runella defluvii TaxID=370973 RepID=A0A7W5ZSY7_9BACT|nr:hypothetical protein [Runella defluvii]MBB3842316.1 hypothetical protein [Runella defluvii]